MSYLNTKPTFTRTTGSTLEQFMIKFKLSHSFLNTLPDGLAGFAQLGCLDAVTVMNAGAMTSTGMGRPTPIFILRGS
jgi:hypothetical protein